MDLVFRGLNRLLALNQDYPSHVLKDSLTRWLRIGDRRIGKSKARVRRSEADPSPARAQFTHAAGASIGRNTTYTPFRPSLSYRNVIHLALQH